MSDPTPTTDNISPSKVVKPITEGDEQAGQHNVRPFAPYMQGKGQTNPLADGSKAPQVSPFDLARGKVPAPGPTFDTIQAQAKTAHSSMGELAQQLNTPKLKLKQSTKYLLKNKLTAAKGNILSASTKLGTPTVEDEKSKGSSALTKFLDLVTSGQRQLEATREQIQQIAASGKTMNPAEMLLVQAKLNKAQQQLDYSSMLLGKAVDDIKQMMNIQL
jgi:hypothetical protein